jgi:hypothetical protein
MSSTFTIKNHVLSVPLGVICHVTRRATSNYGWPLLNARSELCHNPSPAEAFYACCSPCREPFVTDDLPSGLMLTHVAQRRQLRAAKGFNHLRPHGWARAAVRGRGRRTVRVLAIQSSPKLKVRACSGRHMTRKLTTMAGDLHQGAATVRSRQRRPRKAAPKHLHAHNPAHAKDLNVACHRVRLARTRAVFRQLRPVAALRTTQLRSSPLRPSCPAQVVFVTTEVAPWSQVGGLGDVMAALPAALAARWVARPACRGLVDRAPTARLRRRARGAVEAGAPLSRQRLLNCMRLPHPPWRHACGSACAAVAK